MFAKGLGLAFAVSCSLGLNISAQAAASVEFRSSRLQSFYVFLSHLVDSEKSDVLKDAYLQSAYNNSKFQKLLSEFETIYKSDFIDSHLGNDRDSLFLSQSLFSKNLDDFSLRTTGILAPDTHRRLFRIYAELLPVYDRLSWEDISDRAEKIRNNLEKTVTTWNFPQTVETLRKFLHSNWPSESTLYACLVPLPKNKGVSDNFLFRTGFGIVYGIDGYTPGDYFPSLVYQVSQALFKNQSEDYVRELQSDFASLSSIRHSIFAREAFPDFIATAAASLFSQKRGLSFNLLETETHPGRKAVILALAQELDLFLSQEKALDRNFIHKYVSLFKENFPDIIYENHFLYQKIALLYDSPAFRKIKPEESLNLYLAPQRVELLSSPLYLDDVFVPGDARTPFVVVLEKDLQKNKPLFQKQAALRIAFEKLRKNYGSALWKGFDGSGRAFVVIKLRNPAEFSRAIEKLKAPFGNTTALVRF